MRIILFGGAFDPPHAGHSLAAKTVLEKGLADELWFMPCFQHAFAKDMSPAQDRFAMLQLMKLPRTRVSRYEIDRQTVSYSYDTLRHFAKSQPGDTFSWMIGSDNLAKFKSWHKYRELLNAFEVIVYPRKGFPFLPTYPNMKCLRDVQEIETSSTEVRELLHAGKAIDQHVLPQIAQYISKHALYNDIDA